MCRVTVSVLLVLFEFIKVNANDSMMNVIANREWIMPSTETNNYYYHDGDNIDIFCWGRKQKYGSLQVKYDPYNILKDKIEAIYSDKKDVSYKIDGDRYPLHRFTAKLNYAYNFNIACDYENNVKIDINFIKITNRHANKNIMTKIPDIRKYYPGEYASYPDNYTSHYQLYIKGLDVERITLSLYGIEGTKKYTTKYYEYYENETILITCSCPPNDAYSINYKSYSDDANISQYKSSVTKNITLSNAENGTTITCLKKQLTTELTEIKVIFIIQFEEPIIITTNTVATFNYSDSSTEALEPEESTGNEDSKLPDLWVLGAGAVTGLIIIIVAVIIITMIRRKKRLQKPSKDTYENLENQPSSSVTSLPHPPQWDGISNYANPRDFQSDTTVYAEPCNAVPTYAIPIPKNQRNKLAKTPKPIATYAVPLAKKGDKPNYEPTYASLEIPGVRKNRNVVRETDDPNYSEIVTNQANPKNPKYTNVFVGTGYVNAGEPEYVEPAYAECKEAT